MGTPSPELVRVADKAAMAQAAADLLLTRIAANSGRIAICLTGGSSPKQLYELLATQSYRDRIPWPRVHWFIGDERFVPPGDPLHNMTMARHAFLDACAPADNIHAIPTETDSPESSANAYARELMAFYGADALDPARPLFDLVLLGIGPDGHVASLFPGYPAVDVRDRWVVGVDKAHVAPFVPRVSLTLPVLASCRTMLFEVGGTDKRPILARVLAGEDLPANRARSNETTTFLIDDSAWPEQSGKLPHALIVMGVSSSGKSTVGEALGRRLGWRFEDGDSFHPPANVAKMSAGQPLTDEDRWPWLQAIADEVARCRAKGEPIIIACSALKKTYRKILVGDPRDVRLIYLEGDRELIGDRMGHRKGHFMPPGLLDSQFATLEPPGADEHPVTVSVDEPVESIVDDILKQLAIGQDRA
ncbi:putative bifunctional: 6-phosphogluconolactonase (N-terminal) (Pgl); D-gluconate kinase (C-terminal) [Bradyrhizobium sp. ORS 285]|uniref:6-phosphogluconolactonase n=1 Tax=Bradyrhizobium sp. ORS 285 TaxID=115808 RepID=UPI0002409548|nr:6-phosphogluconolactonase [Bradyrhizobium sp. ORS 285]CCD88670.1 putative bifunctional: 6-phosphogluconolactonase (N-terminal) (Pgl); D-gluconate kinase (C-terminal) [Bradyrhizobium sp. ORS 285]SMX56682.1 putative bifunctional: 6-phosphogluconolactonase (N-terminal) (Pgl); D-gluconate kinase (C-terminal) [Bradyrhizobium sp. ORS 285]